MKNNIATSWKIYKSVSGSIDIFNKWADRGLINGQIKQIANTTRWYADISGEMSLHKIIHPRRTFVRLPYWLYKIDVVLFKKFFRYTGINFIFRKWQIYCYAQAYKEVFIKYPNIYHTINHIYMLDKKTLFLYFEYPKDDFNDYELP